MSDPASIPASILVVKPSSLGDVVHALPAVALLKKQWPQSRLRWLINPEWAPLLEKNPDVDEVIHFPRNEFRGLAGIPRLFSWMQSIGKHQSDLVVDFQGLLRSALIGRKCKAKAGEIIGLSDAREGASLFYDRVASVANERHAVDRYLKLVALLGIDISGPLSWPLPVGTIVPGVPSGYVLLHPFSRGAGKSLTPSDVTEFCRAIAPVPVVVAGRSAESIESAPNVTDLLNRTSLVELIGLIRGASYVVSVDSGPMHIAAAITSRLVAIHKWSDPEKVGPYSNEAWIWKEGRLYNRRGLEHGVNGLEALAGFVRNEYRT